MGLCLAHTVMRNFSKFSFQGISVFVLGSWRVRTWGWAWTAGCWEWSFVIMSVSCEYFQKVCNIWILVVGKYFGFLGSATNKTESWSNADVYIPTNPSPNLPPDPSHEGRAFFLLELRCRSCSDQVLKRLCVKIDRDMLKSYCCAVMTVCHSQIGSSKVLRHLYAGLLKVV